MSVSEHPAGRLELPRVPPRTQGAEPMKSRSTLAHQMTERELQRAVVSLAHLRGWHTYHTYDSRRSAAGFPDLVLVREYVVFAELKSEKGKLRPEQLAWQQWLAEAHYHVRLWRPSDWLSGEIERTLALVDP